MSGRRIFSAILSLLGFLFVAMGTGSVVLGLHSSPMILREPNEAMECAENFLGAINNGSLSSASAYLAGHPDLGEIPSDADPVVSLLWDSYRTRLETQIVSDIYAAKDGLAIDIELTYPDAESAAKDIGVLAVARIKQRTDEASDMSELYDDNGQYRAELVDEVMQKAALDVLMKDIPTITTDITLHLVKSEGVWVVLPEQPLLDALSGKAIKN